MRSISELLVDEITRFEKGEIGKDELLVVVSGLREKTTEIKQLNFYDAVVELIDKIEEAIARHKITKL